MIILFILIAVIFLIVLYIILVYNALIKNRNLVEEAWSVINVMLKKRYDLIPNLVETVKGYTTHEKETLQNVVTARNNAQNANEINDKQAAEKNLNQAMMNLFAVAENYPDLKANTNFIHLQSELSSVETDIEKSRRYYNGTVRDYNTRIEVFPNNIVANATGFTKKNFFELENDAERKNPQIKF